MPLGSTVAWGLPVPALLSPWHQPHRNHNNAHRPLQSRAALLQPRLENSSGGTFQCLHGHARSQKRTKTRLRRFLNVLDVPLLLLGHLQAIHPIADVPEHGHHPVHRPHGRCRLFFQLFPAGRVRTFGKSGQFSLCSRTSFALER